MVRWAGVRVRWLADGADGDLEPMAAIGWTGRRGSAGFDDEHRQFSLEDEGLCDTAQEGLADR